MTHKKDELDDGRLFPENDPREVIVQEVSAQAARHLGVLRQLAKEDSGLMPGIRSMIQEVIADIELTLVLAHGFEAGQAKRLDRENTQLIEQIAKMRRRVSNT